jgi:hypothetical protein
MALNIKNAEVERIARLKLHSGRTRSNQRVQAVLSRFGKEFPHGDFGRKVTKREREEILGYGPGGV